MELASRLTPATANICHHRNPRPQRQRPLGKSSAKASAPGFPNSIPPAYAAGDHCPRRRHVLRNRGFDEPSLVAAVIANLPQSRAARSAAVPLRSNSCATSPLTMRNAPASATIANSKGADSGVADDPGFQQRRNSGDVSQRNLLTAKSRLRR